jgi:hypothetical protein
MPQSSKMRFVLIGIRAMCGLAFLAFVFRDFRLEGWRRVLGDIGLAVTVFGIIYASSRQGKKLASDNMRKAGLNPDRDEAHRA